MNQLLLHQNDIGMIKLLRASTAAYQKAKYRENSITCFLILLAFAYPISFVYTPDEQVKLFLFGCSFLLTVLVQLNYNAIRGNTSKGAIFKEEYDVQLFDLPWKSTLKKPDHNEVSNLSILYKGKKIEDWYSTRLSENVPNNIAIAVCQYSNTGWDIDLRKLYVGWLNGFLITYSIALFIFFVVKNVNGLTIFSIGFSILLFYTHFLGLIRGHLSVIEKREAISKKLDEVIFNNREISIGELRDIQDDIYITRQESAKVPNFFFRIYWKRMNAVFEDYIQNVNMIYDADGK